MHFYALHLVYIFSSFSCLSAPKLVLLVVFPSPRFDFLCSRSGLESAIKCLVCVVQILTLSINQRAVKTPIGESQAQIMKQ